MSTSSTLSPAPGSHNIRVSDEHWMFEFGPSPTGTTQLNGFMTTAGMFPGDAGVNKPPVGALLVAINGRTVDSIPFKEAMDCYQNERKGGAVMTLSFASQSPTKGAAAATRVPLAVRQLKLAPTAPAPAAVTSPVSEEGQQSPRSRSSATPIRSRSRRAAAIAADKKIVAGEVIVPTHGASKKTQGVTSALPKDKTPLENSAVDGGAFKRLASQFEDQVHARAFV